MKAARPASLILLLADPSQRIVSTLSLLVSSSAVGEDHTTRLTESIDSVWSVGFIRLSPFTRLFQDKEEENFAFRLIPAYLYLAIGSSLGVFLHILTTRTSACLHSNTRTKARRSSAVTPQDPLDPPSKAAKVEIDPSAIQDPPAKHDHHLSTRESPHSANTQTNYKSKQHGHLGT